MSKTIPYILLGCMIWSIAAPAYAGAVSREPLTEAEDTALALQQTLDADELVEIAAGDGLVTVLAVVGVIFIVMYIAGTVR